MKITIATLSLLLTSVLASAPAPGAQWKRTLFLDDFTGAAGSGPSSSNWILQTGTQYPGGPARWGTNEVQTYTSSSNNVRQSGSGNINIFPRRSSTGQWTSARMETQRNDFAAPAGGKMRIEARIKMPGVTSSNGLGYWPAFWALGGDFRSDRMSWPRVGEIDIMEAVNGQTLVTNSLHCDTAPGGVCNEPSGLGAQTSCLGSVCPGNFHIYEVVLDRSVSPERLNFFVDRQLHRRITQTQLGNAVWAQTFHKGFYLVLNVAMGGAFPDAIAGQTTPTSATVAAKSMEVDYVAVWTT